MRRRRIFVVICILALALGAGYFIHHGMSAGHVSTPAQAVGTVSAAGAAQSAPTANAATTVPQTTRRVAASTTVAPLPPPGTPLKDIYDELKARADAGDADAASRLFHDVRTCFAVHRLENMLPSMMTAALSVKVDAQQSRDDMLTTDAVLKATQHEVDFVQSNRALCDGLDKAQRDSLTPVTLQAARLGDSVALTCYLGSELNAMPGLLDHPEWLATFKSDAMVFAQSAIEQGNWKIVQMLASAYGEPANYSLLGQLSGEDASKSYQFLRLLRLGASDQVSAELDKELARSAQQLSPEQISDADAWAQNNFTKYFAGTSSDEAFKFNSNICHGYDF